MAQEVYYPMQESNYKIQVVLLCQNSKYLVTHLREV